MAIVLTAVVAFQVAGCYTVPVVEQGGKRPPIRLERHPFAIKITNYFYPGGASLSYYLTYESVVVEGTNPYARQTTVELYSGNLDHEERERWLAFIQTFPLEELATDYANRDILDGFSRHFVFRLGSREKQISVVNTSVKPLWELCDEVNSMIPEDLTIGTMHPSVAARLRRQQDPD